MTNRTFMQYFAWNLPEDANHWNRIKAEAMNLARMGITDLWLPPACKGFFGVHDVGYSCYDLYDVGEFNQKESVSTKYGTKREYIDAIEQCHAVGLKVYADVVLGQKVGADETEVVIGNKKNPYDYTIMEKSDTILAWTKFEFPNRKDVYSTFKWNALHFLGVDWDEKRGEKALFEFEGKDYFPNMNRETNQFDYFMGADVDLNHSEVLKETLKWGMWYQEQFHVDGFHIYGIRSADTVFYQRWLSYLRKRTGKNLPAIGEFWCNDTKEITRFAKQNDFSMSFMDVPLYYRMVDISNNGGRYHFSNMLDESLVNVHADAITFVGRHEGTPGWEQGTIVADWFRTFAYTIILLMEKGIPCIFYYDYYGNSQTNLLQVKELPKLIELRIKYAYGAQHIFDGDKDLLGFTREGELGRPASGLAVLLSTGAEGAKRMYVGKRFAGSTFYDIFNKEARTVKIDGDGCGVFFVRGKTISVWIKKIV